MSLAIILVYSFPAFVTLVSIAWLGERTSLLKLFSLLLALGGVALAALLTVDLLGMGGIALRAGLAVAGLAAIGGALLSLLRSLAAVVEPPRRRRDPGRASRATRGEGAGQSSSSSG